MIKKHKDERFWLGVGFVRPHVPFVAPKSYYPPFLPYSKMVLPEKVAGDWDDIPKAGINYKTSINMKMDIRRQMKAMGGYYASVAFILSNGATTAMVGSKIVHDAEYYILDAQNGDK